MFSLRMVTYQGEYQVIDVDSCNLPTTEGRRGILPNHMPVMLLVQVGVMWCRIGGRIERYTVSDGVFMFENNQGVLLAQAIENVRDIDVARAKEAQFRAQEKLRTSANELDIQRARIALRKAINRVNAANGRDTGE